MADEDVCHAATLKRRAMNFLIGCTGCFPPRADPRSVPAQQYRPPRRDHRRPSQGREEGGEEGEGACRRDPEQGC